MAKVTVVIEVPDTDWNVEKISVNNALLHVRSRLGNHYNTFTMDGVWRKEDCGDGFTSVIAFRNDEVVIEDHSSPVKVTFTRK